MNITVNDEPCTVGVQTSLSDLLEQLSVGSARGIAVAVNEQVVPRTEWSGRKLKDRDAVLLITATQGG